MIAGCDVAMAIMIGALAWLLFRGALAPGHLYFFNATSAAIGCIRMPAYRAAVTAIVPRERLTQASGFTGTSQALLRIAAPLIAGYVLADYGLKGIVGLDMLMIAPARRPSSRRYCVRARDSRRGRRGRRFAH